MTPARTAVLVLAILWVRELISERRRILRVKISIELLEPLACLL
jgi:hypothetical protein